jgi:hypothetical protein
MAGTKGEKDDNNYELQAASSALVTTQKEAKRARNTKQ